jgi:hypothetical protein
MGEAQWITGPRRAEAVAQELNSGQRTRPAVVVSIPSSRSVPWIDAERLVGELGDLADVYVLSSVESSWAFSTAMPSRTQVYGGAGRVYPVTLDWVHDPTRSRVRFAYTAAEGEAATTRLIEDGLAAALQGGAPMPQRGAVRPTEVTGLVRGCPTVSQALVSVAGGYASIQVGMAVPGVSSERVFAVGMQVRGFLDEKARRLDVRTSLPDPATRLAEICDGEILWARVESVSQNACEIAPYPGVPMQVPWQEVTTSAADDLHDLMSVGEIVAVRASRGPDGALALSMTGFDEKESPCSALAVFPGGPPWLLPTVTEPRPTTQAADPQPEPTRTPAPPPAPQPVPLPAPQPVPLPVPRAAPTAAPPAPTAAPPAPAAAPPAPTAAPPAPTAAPGSAPATAPPVPVPTAAAPPVPVPTAAALSMPRPSPMLIAKQRHPRHVVASSVVDQGAGSGSESAQALREMSQQLEAARARASQLDVAVKDAETNLRSAQTEMRFLERDLSDQRRDLAARDADLRRLRARIRKNVQEERRVAGRREAAPGEDLFLYPEEQFRFEVTDRWARRIPAAAKADRPLRPYRFGPRFLDSLRELQGIDRPKVADVVVDVLTGLAENSAGRDMHPLRSGTGGDDDILRREGYTCWRVAIQRRSPQARRLHFWRSADDIELSRVVLHDDYAP